jgi:hypothetical protein
MTLPEENVYWRDLWGADHQTRRARLELVGPKGARSYVATFPGGRRAVVYWNGQESRLAQAALDKAVAKDAHGLGPALAQESTGG